MSVEFSQVEQGDSHTTHVIDIEFYSVPEGQEDKHSDVIEFKKYPASQSIHLLVEFSQSSQGD